jgi:hypothetical protein
VAIKGYKKPNKYKAKKTLVGGIKFDSIAESKYYQMLLNQNVSNFKMQVEFVLQDKFKFGTRTIRAIKYKPDFVFYDEEGNITKVVDVKGTRTEVFNIKAKLFLSKYGIQITLAEYDRKKGFFTEIGANETSLKKRT